MTLPGWDGLVQSLAIVLGLTALLVIFEVVVRRSGAKSDLTRRAAHVGAALTGIGVYLTSGPLITAALGLIFVLALGVSQRRNLLTSVHGVERDSYGELLLPLAIAVSAIIAPTPAVFVATMLVTGLADVAAGLVGDLRRATTKTWWGSGAFALVTLIVLLVVMPHLVWTPILVVLATLVERFSRGGSDNLTVPITCLAVLGAQSAGLWS